MSALSQYALLVAVGAVTGFAAQRTTASVRGSITRHLIVRYLLEAIAILPGVVLMGFVLGRRGESGRVFDFLLVAGAFFVPHVAARIGTHRAGASRRARRENALPFLHWFDLLQTNREAAQAFLTTYLADNARRRVDSVPDLQAACAMLRTGHPGHPLLPAALGTLRAEIARLELDRASPSM